MLLLILNSHTDEGFGRNVYKNVFFLSSYIHIYIYIYIYILDTNSADEKRTRNKQKRDVF